MSIEEQLRVKILERYKSVREFALSNNIPYQTLDSILRRGINNAGVGTVIRIFGALDLDVESISTGTLTSLHKNNAPSKEDEELLAAFHQLNAPGQEEMLKYADYLLSRGEYLACGESGEFSQEA